MENQVAKCGISLENRNTAVKLLCAASGHPEFDLITVRIYPAVYSWLEDRFRKIGRWTRRF